MKFVVEYSDLARSGLELMGCQVDTFECKYCDTYYAGSNLADVVKYIRHHIEQKHPLHTVRD